MTGVLLVAAGLRLWRLVAVGLEHDEVANWLIVRGILAGNHGVYFTAAYGHEAGFHYVQAATVALLGDNALALRLPAALCGVLVVAVAYALNRRLFGRFPALLAAAVVAVTFFPTFYSRLALRAVSLPVLSGVSAVFFWQALTRSEKNQAVAWRDYALAGLFGGLAGYTYMASRVLPIFYTAFALALIIREHTTWRRQWHGIMLFAAVAAAVVAPLALYLLNAPQAEFRITEINGPLTALRQGDLRPVLTNALAIVRGFGGRGDPLWRQNVAGAPIFDPALALLFYAGIGVMLWRRERRDVFTLLWLGTAVIPSVVTVDAPSTIRMINLLPLLGAPVSRVVHTVAQLSTESRWLSTSNRRKSWIIGLTLVLLWGIGRTTLYTHIRWPAGSEVQFVWQQAFTAMARHLDADPSTGPVTFVGWTPESMDPPTIELALQRDDLALRFAPPETLIVPAAGPVRILRPRTPDLPLPPALDGRLAAWGAVVTPYPDFVEYRLHPPDVAAQPVATLGGELALLDVAGCDSVESDSAESASPTAPCALLTTWRVTQTPTGPRSIFLHVVDADGAILSQSDGLGAPTAFWQPGDLIVRHHAVALPPGAVAVRIGITDAQTQQRLTTADGRNVIELSVAGLR